MKNRLASLFELDDLLGRVTERKNGGDRRRRRAKLKKKSAAPAMATSPAPAPAVESKPVAQSFDRGDPIRCQHSENYRPVGTVDVPDAAAGAQMPTAAAFEVDYTVEAFDDDDDGDPMLRLADVQAEARLSSQESASDFGTSYDIEEDADDEADDEEPASLSYRPERELPPSFAAQMTAVERDLADLATRVQPSSPSEPTPAESPDVAGSSTPGAAPAGQHGIFDQMAQGMSYATEFRLPAVQLSQVFSALDRQLDSEKEVRVAPDASGVRAEPGIVPSPAPAVVPPNDVLLRDLMGLPRADDRIPAAGVAPAPVMAAAAIDVRHDVQLVPQLTGFSCWAAGAAMLVSWRDRVSVDPSEIARATGYWAQYAAGLHPEDVKMFAAWRLTPEAAQSYTIPGFADLLRKHGPLWVASAEPGPHIRVVTGMVGDGTPNGTLVYINDPWEQGMNIFKMPNRGSRYTETYQRFIEKQEQLARQEIKLQGIYVAHN